MSKVFHIGDIHIGHKNILKYRPMFASITEHNETILDNIKRNVTKRDTLYLHGDCFFTFKSLVFLSELRYINRIHWILGNHDTDNSERISNVMYAVQHGMVDSVQSLIKYKGFWLSHAPIHPDELRGAGCIHGHVHSNTLPDSRYFNVSCENVNYTPIEHSDIKARLTAYSRIECD